ncbi:WD40 repeat-like protein [Guyanagaster necrorhizus]|uniref:WD40 repeat-like protein n=1 Tax=Guyanagaster necrorhizus TaxID=856835 RepID=A0A9P8AXY7_9AGAR|nr:WD40 repeat-like protein [Guyanagaster necrorhizus MCA 3950]KAG7452299.1 WD40 repeat-like protein [Guyanagaster necrorhizus MCA 3950]
MPASTSKEPQNVPLPQSPSPMNVSQLPSKRKGKEKQATGISQKRRVAPKSVDTLNTWNTSDVDLDWGWISLADPYTSKVPPVFTKDGSYFFSLVGPHIKIYSVATVQVVSTLSAPRSTSGDVSSDLLTCAILNPHNAFQLITGSLNGRIHIWDFLDANLLKTIDVSQPIYHLCAHEKHKDAVFVAVARPSKHKSKDDNAVVLRVSLKTAPASKQSSVQKSSEISPIGKTLFPTGLAFSASGEWLVATAGHKAYVTSLSSPNPQFTKYVSPERLCCLAFHPSEDYFATGDGKGNIRLWYCLNEQVNVKAVGVEKKTQTSSFHWHAHPVASLAFTSNGAYLLSGGEEAVLVMWQLETGKKEFVPRVGAPISTVSISKAGHEEEYLLGLADGTYLFISAASLKISRGYSRIRIDPSVVQSGASTSKITASPIVSHATTSTLILPSSHPSSLQIYSPTSSKFISELEVSPSNRVARKDEKALEPAKIELVVITSSGEWMATIDRREGDANSHGENYLKFWWWDRKAGFWILNTRIDRPHGLSKVTDIAFSPSQESASLLLVTTGEDNNIKTWSIRTSRDESASDFWAVRSTFSFRSQTPTCVSWAPDASLLAVSLGIYIVLYDPITCTSHRILTTPECPEVSSNFFVGTSGRYLAVVGGHDLALWDLVLQSVRWHYRCPSPIKTVLPLQDSFVVLLEAVTITYACIFSPLSSAPSRSLKLPFTLRGIASYTPTNFVGITKDWSVVVFGDNVSAISEEGSAARGIPTSSVPQARTLFQDIFGKSAFTPQTFTNRPSSAAISASSKVRSLFDGPSYYMPPLESLFDDVMDDFLKPRQVKMASISEDDADVGMDVDEPADVPPAVVRRKLVVNEEEMGMFVDLFKAHALKPKSHPQLPPARKATANGVSKPRTNGHSTPKKPSVKVSPNIIPQAPTSSSPLPATNGKKRKMVSD